MPQHQPSSIVSAPKESQLQRPATQMFQEALPYLTWPAATAEIAALVALAAAVDDCEIACVLDMAVDVVEPALEKGYVVVHAP